MTTQMRPTQAARVVQVRIRPFEQFLALTQEPLAAPGAAELKPNVVGEGLREAAYHGCA
jgi:hypothetical protein